MYGASSGIGPMAGGGGGAVLAYTGTGSLLVPLVIAGIAVTVGILLTIRARVLRNRALGESA